MYPKLPLIVSYQQGTFKVHATYLILFDMNYKLHANLLCVYLSNSWIRHFQYLVHLITLYIQVK